MRSVGRVAARRVVWPVMWLLGACLGAACGGDDPGLPEGGGTAQAPRRPLAQQPESHERMLQLLREVADATDEDDLYQGTVRAAYLAEQRDRLGVRGSWKLYMDSGISELQRGEERLGLELLQQAYQRAQRREGQERVDALNQVRFHLGVGFLRLAETQNCCASEAPEACILPFAPAALHLETEGAEGAIHYLGELLAATPPESRMHRGGRWLLNLAHLALGQHPDGVAEDYRIPAAAFESARPFPRFENVARKLGIDTFSLSGGAIADDFDGDGDLDLVVSSWDRRHSVRFWRNLGDGTFADHTAAAGLEGIYGGLNMVQADYDNDGDLDILVLRGAWLGEKGRLPNSLLRNDGTGRFSDVTFSAGLGQVHYPTQTASWADDDNDGDLDLYIGNEATEAAPFPSQLFRNQGDGTFRDVAAVAGVENRRYAKAVAWGDIDGDGDPDLYVSNNGQPNRLYQNQGDGTYVDVAHAVGVAGPTTSFPAWFWDVDDDGALDLFVSSYSTDIDHLCAHLLGEPVAAPGMALYFGDGRGGFEDRAVASGLSEPTMPMGSNFGDLDGEGTLDFLLGTGNVHYYSLMPNALFVGGGERRFENVTMASGMGHLQKGHAVVFADFDNDGDLDVFEQMGGAYKGDGFRDALWENPGFGHRWLAVQLRGVASNRSAIGARIHVRYLDEEGRERSSYRHVNSGGSFGANPLRQFFGLGHASSVVAVEVHWPRTGATQRVEGIGLDTAVEITEGVDDPKPLRLARVRLGG